ncbi:hypothetical protein [uncultured Dokdonia sp.]|uniref:hypothetical protein n=1 Tax=uncultured Dokdonia sp. TaxID=575653 RepID=UPI0026112C36|nr:hypothetical protein [uncultured Dokdonia sp.]
MKSTNKKSIIYVLLFLVFQSCSSPLDKKYNEDTLEIDAKEIKESDKLSEEDAEILAGWILKSKLTNDDLEGKTYAEIIDEAKLYKKEQEELAEKIKAEEEANRQRLGASLTVAMYNKGFKKYDYQEYLTYDFVFENKSKKDIRAFKGSVSIRDLFDVEIKSINLTVDDKIEAFKILKASYTSDYNQFRDEDTRLRNKDMDDVKIVWTPEKIIFTDGSILE